MVGRGWRWSTPTPRPRPLPNPRHPTYLRITALIRCCRCVREGGGVGRWVENGGWARAGRWWLATGVGRDGRRRVDTLDAAVGRGGSHRPRPNSSLPHLQLQSLVLRHRSAGRDGDGDGGGQNLVPLNLNPSREALHQTRRVYAARDHARPRGRSRRAPSNYLVPENFPARSRTLPRRRE